MNLEEFTSFPVMKELSQKTRWTISTDKKMPVDMRRLMEDGAIHGAKAKNDTCLASLDEIGAFLSKYNATPTNLALYLNAYLDGFVILDIEPKCPDDIKKKLTAIPCLYAEKSMSGQGFHMVFREPRDIYKRYPSARGKIALKEENGFYEVLMDHYVTFTGNVIPFNQQGLDYPQPLEFLELFEKLASNARATPAGYEIGAEAEEIEFIDIDSITHGPEIVEFMAETELPAPDRYGKDMSRAEFAACIKMIARMELAIAKLEQAGEKISIEDSERVAMLYEAAKRAIPSREKHEQSRQGMPWLLHVAWHAYERYMASEEAKKEESENELSRIAEPAQKMTETRRRFLGSSGIKSIMNGGQHNEAD